MNDNSLPSETLRTLGVMLVLAFDFALEKSRDAIERIKPIVEPPDDLRIISNTGCLYSGVIFVDRGEVLAGVVVATGFDPLRAASARASTIAAQPVSHAGAPLVRRETGLPSWAEDPTNYDDEPRPPWRR